VSCQSRRACSRLFSGSSSSSCSIRSTFCWHSSDEDHECRRQNAAPAVLELACSAAPLPVLQALRPASQQDDRSHCNTCCAQQLLTSVQWPLLCVLQASRTTSQIAIHAVRSNCLRLFSSSYPLSCKHGNTSCWHPDGITAGAATMSCIPPHLQLAANTMQGCAIPQRRYS
jgi:hypothetical protein